MNLKIIKNVLNSKTISNMIPKNKYKTKNWEKFWSNNKFRNAKILKYFSKVQNSYFSTYSQRYTQTTKFKLNRTLLDRICSSLTFFCHLIKKIKVLILVYKNFGVKNLNLNMALVLPGHIRFTSYVSCIF